MRFGTAMKLWCIQIELKTNEGESRKSDKNLVAEAHAVDVRQLPIGFVWTGASYCLEQKGCKCAANACDG